ncbi:hypothetical protein CCMA1212_005177 [Trichoderma ghanense]|uniref:DUF6546 domain-containing protein n=1 Tax=Trichoderma ghanense TaxID=65468 RepID=A0ABY2H6I3_9HYPO
MRARAIFISRKPEPQGSAPRDVVTIEISRLIANMPTLVELPGSINLPHQQQTVEDITANMAEQLSQLLTGIRASLERSGETHQPVLAKGVIATREDVRKLTATGMYVIPSIILNLSYLEEESVHPAIPNSIISIPWLHKHSLWNMSPVALDAATAPHAGRIAIVNHQRLLRGPPFQLNLRSMILSLVALPVSRRRYDGPGSPKLAQLATVCREWQAFFETRTFRRLVLHPDSLAEFEAIMRRHDARLGYIRRLWLRIQLSVYECPDCDESEDEATQHRNNVIFTTCMMSLLGTLKLWDLARHGAQGLALMLSASSPSDTEHRFSRCEIKDGYPFHYAEDFGLAPGMCEIPKLERDYGLEEVGSEAPLHAQAHLPREMAKVSQRLEQLCPPWQMDAAAFLQSIIKLGEATKMPESSLRRMILHCSLPNPGSSRPRFRSLVLLAAKAALSLPQLEIIELLGDLCEDGRASIVLRSLEEDMVAQARIIAAWNEVAQKHSHRTLPYNVVPFAETEAEVFWSDGTCVYRHLMPKDLVFDPITRKILEHEPMDWNLDEETGLHFNFLLPLLARPNLLGGLGPDNDLASLQADVMAFDAEVTASVQQNYG